MNERRLVASEETINLLNKLSEELQVKTTSKTLLKALKEYFIQKERISYLQDQIKFLQAENDDLKKLYILEKEKEETLNSLKKRYK